MTLTKNEVSYLRDRIINPLQKALAQGNTAWATTIVAGGIVAGGLLAAVTAGLAAIIGATILDGVVTFAGGLDDTGANTLAWLDKIMDDYLSSTLANNFYLDITTQLDAVECRSVTGTLEVCTAYYRHTLYAGYDSYSPEQDDYYPVPDVIEISDELAERLRPAVGNSSGEGH